MKTDLISAMRDLAATGHPAKDKLLKAVEKLENVLSDKNASATKILGAWAHARITWSEAIGQNVMAPLPGEK